MKIQRSKKGFTLVEIMIVVVIIGLLAAMAIPAFQKVRRQSFAKAMANDARQIGSALQQVYMSTPTMAAVTVLSGANYNSLTGTIRANVIDPASTRDVLTQLVSKIGTGYVLTDYDSTVAPGAEAFTMTHARVAPREVGSPDTTVNVSTATGVAVSFDNEGKAR
jgi:type IV pilus assembly protein PilA